ncbi:DUF3696 domain-containing protein [Anaerolineales bacterium HSG25]|nr:DUF3696 domain-containing protein [Anaerolineales bacterium HSG25]
MKSFRLKNIKSFEDTGEIELKPITVFVGPNSSGKSSLLRFPVVISQTYLDDAIAPIIFHGKYVDYGNFDDVVHDHSGDTVNFEITFDYLKLTHFLRYTNMASALRHAFREKSLTKSVKLNITTRKSKRNINVHQYTITIGTEKFFSLKETNDGYQINLYYLFFQKGMSKLDIPITLPVHKLTFEKFIIERRSWRRAISRAIEKKAHDKFNYSKNQLSAISEFLTPSLSRFFHKPTDDLISELSEKDKEVVEYLNKVWETLFAIEAISNALDRYLNHFSQNMNYIGPFRTDPKRNYRQSESLYDYVGKNGENVSMLLRQAERDQHPLFKRVSNWFSEAMGYQIGIDEIPESNLFKIKVYSEQKPKGDNLIDVGFGISQILPIVTQLYYDKQQDNENRSRLYSRYSPQTFVIEQPEIHLHPHAQAELANLFVERILIARIQKDNTPQILIETHSEHLIRRLQSLVANPEVAFTAEDVSIYYVEMDKTGTSHVQKMNMNESGQFIERWPSGFFDKGYLLSKELARNASKKAAA